METPQKIIRIIPYKGINSEILEGKKTKISLFENRLEYSIKFTEKVKVEKVEDYYEMPEEVSSYTDEEGFILKNNIAAITKYIQTEYIGDDKDSLETHKVNYIDICSTSNALTFSLEDETTKNSLYLELYNWLFNGR